MESNPGKKRTVGNRLVTVIVAVAFGAVVIVLFAAGYYYSIKTPEKEIPAATMTPVTEAETGELIPPVLSGRQSYKLLTNENPFFTEVWIDPLDAPRGMSQDISARVENPSPVRKVYVTVITDNKEEVVSLRLSDGSEYNGIWSASHVISGTYEKIYRFRFTAEDQSGKASSVTITSR